MYIFSKRLKEAIELRGVTQAWVAKNSNTTEATVSRYVKADRNPAVIDILSDIAKTLNVSSDYLIGLTDKPIKYDNTTPEPYDQELLVKCYKNISKNDEKVLWALLDKYLTSEESHKLNSFLSKKN